jgi:hypothetical protein
MLTFENLPAAIEDVLQRLEKIESKLVPMPLEGPSLPEKLITTQTLMKILDLSEPTIIRYRQKGKIPYIQIGSAIRYDLGKVLEALAIRKKR